MAIPTATGSEVLRRGAISAQSNNDTTLLFAGTSPATGADGNTVPANHIIIMLSMIFCEVAGNAETIKFWHNSVTIVESQAIAANETYVYNDKFVLYGGDTLAVLASSGDVDVYYSFIDQNWS